MIKSFKKTRHDEDMLVYKKVWYIKDENDPKVGLREFHTADKVIDLRLGRACKDRYKQERIVPVILLRLPA